MDEITSLSFKSKYFLYVLKYWRQMTDIDLFLQKNPVF